MYSNISECAVTYESRCTRVIVERGLLINAKKKNGITGREYDTDRVRARRRNRTNRNIVQSCNGWDGIQKRFSLRSQWANVKLDSECTLLSLVARASLSFTLSPSRQIPGVGSKSSTRLAVICVYLAADWLVYTPVYNRVQGRSKPKPRSGYTNDVFDSSKEKLAQTRQTRFC